ncbi:hypothetical protein TWF192_009797 [Orbilia oligospora]|uniref:F-box domain-containing protein n=1 Tax=Orbilia oligospora TaxID=2813651 RepID=A0A6G1MIS0_ORBOL|nr:hypothetical protein TWF191_010254 [Orbilia oligospora]KAF3260519.1 hypothetical protein TWF192_009797 [Orbilia oligospora]
MHMRLRIGSRKTATASVKGKQPETQPTSSIFLIHEVLEGILLEVPAIDLILNCRAVCKTWKDLIESTSPDLKYYSLSGLRRTSASASATENEEEKRPETPTLPPWVDPTPTYHTVAKPNPILTPLALDILRIFWKRMVKKNVKTRKARPVKEEQPSLSLHLGRKVYKAMHCGMRSYDSSRESGVVYTSFMCIIFCIIMPIGTPIYKFYDSVLREMGPTHIKQRIFKRNCTRLVKEFKPIWQKVQIFYPSGSEGISVNIGAHTNWRSEDNWWDYDFELTTYFDGLPEAALGLMMPLIEAAYSHRLSGVDPTLVASSDPYNAETVVIDLRHRSEVNHAHRYVDYSPREVIIFEGQRPHDVSRRFLRPPNVGYARISDKIVRS